MKNDLGLPFEYKEFPNLFDHVCINDVEQLKNNFIAKILEKYKIKTVLDMMCGTGSQVFFLKKLGYDIIGSDFSPELLKIAREKATQNSINVTFIDGDARTLNIGRFDSVITIFNAIGHLTKQDFEMTLKNIKNNLKQNGIYIFDILNLQVISQNLSKDSKFTLIKQIDENTKINLNQTSEIDSENGVLTSSDELIINNEKTLRREFSLQIYTFDQLNDILNKNGFNIIDKYSTYGSEFIPDQTKNILIIAQTNKLF